MGFIWASVRALIRPRVSEVAGACRLTTSAARQHLVQGGVARAAGGAAPSSWTDVVDQDLHPEGAGAQGHLAPDAPEPDQAQGGPAQLDPRGPLPLPGPRLVGHGDQVAGQGQDQGQGVVGHGVLVRPRGGGDPHPQLGRRRDVDGVEADAEARDDFEAGGGAEDAPAEVVRAGQHGVHVTQERDQLVRGRRARSNGVPRSAHPAPSRRAACSPSMRRRLVPGDQDVEGAHGAGLASAGRYSSRGGLKMSRQTAPPGPLRRRG